MKNIPLYLISLLMKAATFDIVRAFRNIAVGLRCPVRRSLGEDGRAAMIPIRRGGTIERVSRLMVMAVLLSLPLGALAADVSTNHEAEVRALVGQLAENDFTVRLQAKLQLLRPEAGPLLKNHEAEIVAALQDDWRSDEAARLLGRLDLPSGLARQLRDSGETPDCVRARLGDEAALRRVIVTFQEARGFGAIHSAASDLAYVESPATLQAFALGLASRDVVEDVHGNQVSVALLLIQAYGEKHPEEPSFQPAEYLKHADVSPAVFRQAGHQNFLRQIESRLLARHQLRVTLDPPILLNTDKVEKYR